MWIIQTPLRTAFHDLNEKLNSSCGLLECRIYFFIQAYEEMKK